MQWTPLHVKHWINWAVDEFKLESVDVSNFSMTGAELCDLTHSDFVKYIPFDRGDIFWTHLELLRKCKFVGKRHFCDNFLFCEMLFHKEVKICCD